MDRITQVRIRNVRAIEALDLDVSRMTVLIGENGAGKSTIIECLEILRQAAEPRFMERLYAIHQGAFGLLRRGATSMSFGVTIEDDQGALPSVSYHLVLGERQGGLEVQHEMVLLIYPNGKDSPKVILNRMVAGAHLVLEDRAKKETSVPQAVLTDQLLLTAYGSMPPRLELRRLIAALERIEVHISFDSLASWAARSLQRPQSIRTSTTLFPAKRLSLLGTNLASAWAELRNHNQQEWDYTLGLARVGLGSTLDTVAVTPDAGGGNVTLSLRFSHFKEPVPAAGLSNGQLTWLAFVAIVRLRDPATLLAIDEPELHLHPGLLGRLVSALQNLDGPGPVVLATHSDRVLSLLDDPVESVRVLSLVKGSVVQQRLDAEALAVWLAEYGSLGAVREEGLLPQVLIEPVETSPPMVVKVPEADE